MSVGECSCRASHVNADGRWMTKAADMGRSEPAGSEESLFPRPLSRRVAEAARLGYS
jgi:hypothetical protein